MLLALERLALDIREGDSRRPKKLAMPPNMDVRRGGSSSPSGPFSVVAVDFRRLLACLSCRGEPPSSSESAIASVPTLCEVFCLLRRFIDERPSRSRGLASYTRLPLREPTPRALADLRPVTLLGIVTEPGPSNIEPSASSLPLNELIDLRG